MIDFIHKESPLSVPLSNVKLITCSQRYDQSKESQSIIRLDSVIRDIEWQAIEIKPEVIEAKTQTEVDLESAKIISKLECVRIEKNSKTKIPIKFSMQYNCIDETSLPVIPFVESLGPQFFFGENWKEDIGIDVCRHCSSVELDQLKKLNDIREWRKSLSPIKLKSLSTKRKNI